MVKKAGARIDGVGFQGHFTLDELPPADDMANSLRSLTDLGVDVAYTEMDVRMKMPTSTQKLQKHAQGYADLAKSCLMVPRCVGITIWVSKFSVTTEYMRVLTERTTAGCFRQELMGTIGISGRGFRPSVGQQLPEEAGVQCFPQGNPGNATFGRVCRKRRRRNRGRRTRH